MGGQVRGVPEASSLTGEVSTGSTSIGIYLARERRLRGVSLDELAYLTKIPRRSLERLEAGAFDSNPDGFARGFVRTVAVALGLSPEEAVVRMLGEPLGSDESPPFTSSQRGRWLLVGVVLLISAGLLAVVFWGQQASRQPEANVQNTPAIVYRRDAVRALLQEQVQIQQSVQTESGRFPPETR
jgi:cytoskeletal protein RodZ